MGGVAMACSICGDLHLVLGKVDTVIVYVCPAVGSAARDQAGG